MFTLYMYIIYTWLQNYMWHLCTYIPIYISIFGWPRLCLFLLIDPDIAKRDRKMPSNGVIFQQPINHCSITDCIIFKGRGLDSIGFPFCLKTKQHTAWILLIVAWMFVLDLTMRWDSWLMTHEPIIVLNVVARWWSLLEFFFHWKLLTTGSTSLKKMDEVKSSVLFGFLGMFLFSPNQISTTVTKFQTFIYSEGSPEPKKCQKIPDEFTEVILGWVTSR